MLKLTTKSHESQINKTNPNSNKNPFQIFTKLLAAAYQLKSLSREIELLRCVCTNTTIDQAWEIYIFSISFAVKFRKTYLEDDRSDFAFVYATGVKA